MNRLVTTTYLEMTSREEFRPCDSMPGYFGLKRVEIPCPELNRFFYVTVGADWWWYCRLAWNYAQWRAFVDREELETWVAYVSGTPAGYFELERQRKRNVEIVHFGLLPQFIGRGLGGPLLSASIRRAWDMGAQRVWVHTCDLDHPRALANYQARGFGVYHVESNIENFPDQPLDLWPGARTP